MQHHLRLSKLLFLTEINITHTVTQAEKLESSWTTSHSSQTIPNHLLSYAEGTPSETYFLKAIYSPAIK